MRPKGKTTADLMVCTYAYLQSKEEKRFVQFSHILPRAKSDP